MSDKKNRPFFIFTLSIFIVLIVPSLIQDGMFMDGLLYTVAAKNLANGIGTWWNMHINNYTHSGFFEQPPLTFWIQSFFFKVFGNSIYTERIYSFTTACISGWLILKIWKTIYYQQPEINKINWLPILFWIIVPLCFWTYTNNMEECTMSIFILLSVWMIIKGFQKNKPLHYLLIAGVCIFLSSMCKGIQGMFPLSLAAIYWLIYREYSFLKMILYSILLIAVPLLTYFFLFQSNSAFHFFEEYYKSRLYNAFNSPGVYTTNNHFEILIRLLTDLSIPMIICLTMILVFKIKTPGTVITKPQWKIFFLFVLTGLSGSLPLMVTLEQRRFYLTPSIPFFAIAIASLIAPQISMMIEKINTDGKFYRYFKKISVLLFAAVIIFSLSQIGKTRRDKEMLHDVYTIGKMIPANSDINMHPVFVENWSLQLYFTRHYNITLNPDQNKKFAYLVMPDTAKADMKKYSEVNLKLKIYKLYKLSH